MNLYIYMYIISKWTNWFSVSLDANMWYDRSSLQTSVECWEGLMFLYVGPRGASRLSDDPCALTPPSPLATAPFPCSGLSVTWETLAVSLPSLFPSVEAHCRKIQYMLFAWGSDSTIEIQIQIHPRGFFPGLLEKLWCIWTVNLWFMSAVSALT